MAGGLLMVLTGALVICQVTKGQALQRLGIVQPTSGGISGLLTGIKAVSPVTNLLP